MAYNIFDTHTLLASVEQLPPMHTFLRDRYFPTNAATDIFSTNDVLMEYRKGSKKAAPVVAPRKGGITIMRDGYTVRAYRPAQIKPQRPLTIDDLSQRGFGEALYSKLTPEQRQGVMMLRDVDELRDMIARRVEAMAAETIFNNGCIMEEYTDDLGHYEEKEVFFHEGDANPGTYTPAATWTTTEESGKQMVADVAAMIRMNTSRGIPATEVLMAPDVADIFQANEWILRLMDNRNYNIGGIDPNLLPSGVVRVARLNINGRMIDFLSYEDTYTEIGADAKPTPFIPAGKIAVAAPGMGRTVYGAISQVEQHDGAVHTYAGMYVPKYMADPINDVRQVRVASAPLCIPNYEAPFISAQVL